MEFCRFLRSVKFVVRSLGRFLGRGVCLWLQRSQGFVLMTTVVSLPGICFDDYSSFSSSVVLIFSFVKYKKQYI